MRSKEFVTETQSTGTSTRARSVTAPRVSTFDKSAPWTRAAMGKARQRKKSFEDLATAKEKFDFLYTLKQGKTTNRIVINSHLRNNYQLQSYDPVTGNIVVTLITPESKQTYSGNTKDFTYRGSEKPGAGSARNYIFLADPRKLEMIDSQPMRRGAPPGSRKKQYNFPKMPW